MNADFSIRLFNLHPPFQFFSQITHSLVSHGCMRSRVTRGIRRLTQHHLYVCVRRRRRGDVFFVFLYIKHSCRRLR